MTDGLRIFPLRKKAEELSRKYDENYFSELSAYLDDISEEEADCMIRTIGKFYEIMCERRKHYDMIKQILPREIS